MIVDRRACHEKPRAYETWSQVKGLIHAKCEVFEDIFIAVSKALQTSGQNAQ